MPRFFNKIMNTIIRLPSFKVDRKSSNSGDSIYLINSENDLKLSFWKDIPLTTNNFKTVNALFEVPRLTCAKVEIINEDEHHPLR